MKTVTATMFMMTVVGKEMGNMYHGALVNLRQVGLCFVYHLEITTSPKIVSASYTV
jgi:hypothetical protein